MKYIYLILTLITLFSSCDRQHKEDPRLQAAGKLVETNPDSAYRMLNGIRGQVIKWPEDERMSYYMLLSDAQNRAFVSFSSDSVMKQVADYYDANGDNNQQIKAYYLLGSVYRDLDEASRSLECFNHCISLCDTTSSDCNYLILSKVHAQKGGLFHNQQMSQNSLVEFKVASRYALMAKDTLLYINYLEQEASFYDEEDKRDSAADVSERVHDLYKKCGCDGYARMSLAYAIYKYTIDNNLTKAKRYLDEYAGNPALYDKEGKVLKTSLFLHYYQGMYYLYDNKPDSARVFFTQLLHSDDITDRQGGYEGLYMTCKKTGQTASALRYHELYSTATDTIRNTLQVERIQQIQSLYDYQDYQKKVMTQKSELYSTRLTVAILIFVLIVLVLLVLRIISWLKQKAKDKIDAINHDYSLSVARLDKAQGDLLLMKESSIGDGRRIEEKEREIQHLNNVIKDLRVGKKKNGQWNERDVLEVPVVTEFHSYALHASMPSEEKWRVLMTFAECEFPKLFEKIESSGIIKDKDKRICVLVKLQFIPSEMCVIFDKSSQAVSNWRVRLMQKMFGIKDNPSVFDEKIKEIR